MHTNDAPVSCSTFYEPVEFASSARCRTKAIIDEVAKKFRFGTIEPIEKVFFYAIQEMVSIVGPILVPIAYTIGLHVKFTRDRKAI